VPLGGNAILLAIALGCVGATAWIVHGRRRGAVSA
jgi:hypothetical protein